MQPGAEYKQVAAAIIAGLEAYVDPATGEHPVAHVFTRDEAYGIYDPRAHPRPHPLEQRGLPGGLAGQPGRHRQGDRRAQHQIWSGDHCSVYPPLVNGILFANFKLRRRGEAYMGDVMPTILDLYGVQPPERLDGKSLLPDHR